MEEVQTLRRCLNQADDVMELKGKITYPLLQIRSQTDGQEMVFTSIDQAVRAYELPRYVHEAKGIKEEKKAPTTRGKSPVPPVTGLLSSTTKSHQENLYTSTLQGSSSPIHFSVKVSSPKDTSVVASSRASPTKTGDVKKFIVHFYVNVPCLTAHIFQTTLLK